MIGHFLSLQAIRFDNAPVSRSDLRCAGGSRLRRCEAAVPVFVVLHQTLPSRCGAVSSRRKRHALHVSLRLYFCIEQAGLNDGQKLIALTLAGVLAQTQPALFVTGARAGDEVRPFSAVLSM